MRVFHDRLINTQDTTWFIDLMMELLNNNFKSGTERNDLFGETKIMFGDILFPFVSKIRSYNLV